GWPARDADLSRIADPLDLLSRRIVAWSAERNPVIDGKEQLLVVLVRDAMMHDARAHQSPLLVAPFTYWVLGQEQLSAFTILPAVIEAPAFDGFCRALLVDASGHVAPHQSGGGGGGARTDRSSPIGAGYCRAQGLRVL